MTVEVTQADRDAASAYVGANFGVKYIQGTREGTAWTGLSEAFARHRIAHQGQVTTPTVKDSLTGDVAELVERLNAREQFVTDPISLKPRLRNPDGPKAADKLTELAAEVERLRAEKD